VNLLADRILARIVAILYLAAPLGIYYSRSVHIDFTAICFAHALLFCSMRYLDRGGTGTLALATLAGSLAFLIKAPYAFYLIVPAVWYAWSDRDRRARLAPVVAVFGWSALMFGAWHAYSQRINHQAPDLSFIPSYRPYVDRYEWYFGTLADRARIDAWYTVIGRVYREIAGTVWWILVPFGFLAGARLGRYFSFAFAWSVGAAAFLLLFFTLNEAHNYYQIPFIAPFSLWLAAPIYACWMAKPPRSHIGRIGAALALTGYVGTSLFVAHRRFYRTDPYQLTVGRLIQTRSSDMDLVVMSHAAARHGDPSFLFYARRYGWSVGPDELSPAVIESLRPHGATLVVTSSAEPPSPATRAYLAKWPVVEAAQIEGTEVTIRRLAAPRRWP
jgi:hypothetical protein